MNAFLLYVVQSTLCLSLFYGLYLLLLRREAFFRFNRGVLLAIMASSMIIPLIRVPLAEPALVQLPMIQLEEMVSGFKFQVQSSKYHVSSEMNTENINSDGLVGIPETSNFKPETSNLIPLAYLAGLSISLALALISLISVARIIVSARPVAYRQQRILVSPLHISSFTFAGWLVISEMDYERFAAEIVTHETIHRRSGHFWDLCLVNVIAVVHWFNPLAWLLRREVKTLHEYDADRCTLTQGIDATRYKLLLIEKAAGASRYSVASGFAQSKIKKRIVMMNNTQNPNPWARWKVLLFIPLAALLVQCFARPEVNRELEQISALKDTEIVQENTDWSEEKFLAELRKCLPEGVSHELSYEDTWIEVAKMYQFPQKSGGPPPQGAAKSDLPPHNGMVILMNKLGALMANTTRVTIDEVPDLLAENLAQKGNSAAPLTIDGKEVRKIIRWTWIQRDVYAPEEEFQKLLNAVGEAYISKRNEVAQKYYQTGYQALDEEKKSVIDDIVPMLVNIDEPKRTRLPNKEEWEKAAKKTEEETTTVRVTAMASTTLPSEEEWKEAAKIYNRLITYNGKPVKVIDLSDLLNKDDNNNLMVRMLYMSLYDYKGQEIINKRHVSIVGTTFSRKTNDLTYYYVIDGKRVDSIDMSINKIQTIDVYTPADAVIKYGNDAKNGAVAITTQ